jgi:hypothetical protein
MPALFRQSVLGGEVCAAGALEDISSLSRKLCLRVNAKLARSPLQNRKAISRLLCARIEKNCPQVPFAGFSRAGTIFDILNSWPCWRPSQPVGGRTVRPYRSDPSTRDRHATAIASFRA